MIRWFFRLCDRIVRHSYTKKAASSTWAGTKKVGKFTSDVSLRMIGGGARYVAETVEARDTLRSIRSRNNHERLTDIEIRQLREKLRQDQR